MPTPVSPAPVRPPTVSTTPALAATETPKPRTQTGWLGKHEALVAKARTNPQLAFYGDSITAGMSADRAFRRSFGTTAENFGIVGDSTQHLRWRLQNGEVAPSASKAVLLIGANNIGAASDANIVKGILANVKELRHRAPNSKLLVLGVLPQGLTATDPRRATIRHINTLVQEHLRGMPNVTFQDIGSKLLQPDGSMSRTMWWGDGLHPRNYEPFFAAIQPTLARL